ISVFNSLTLCTWIFFQNLGPPFSDYALCIFRSTSKAESANYRGALAFDRRQRHEGIFRIELFDFAGCLSNSIRPQQICEWFAKKILDRRFSVKRINIGMMPLVASPI